MNKLAPTFVVLVIGLIMAIAVGDMPPFGALNSPASSYLSPYYIKEAYDVAGVHNIVTAVLAYWRGYDTFGEVTVIFTAGIAVMALLGRE
ncbi:MAG: Multisubunit Na+/H+ antiporter MnhB subunit [Candidatus Methanohalarchaeum thermophilum]|uniref:Multisubunit Na+/H+ antiporter MnhB subunit n=1 Tax=Methanohalarchaeum thermophilum TaxID=1903181 RepID=A0A1Q6DUR9_METT1|nr:MAG: Multisubunit Na+/H+ antiporter MnhB subunit [Candidatus Methanohalarchaeum thermophilum]